MKTQIRTLAALATLIALGLAAAPAAAADPAPMTAKKPIVAYTKVLETVEQRPDFGVLEGVHYDTAMRAWDFRYTKDDGAPAAVKMDAVTGKEITMFGALQ